VRQQVPLAEQADEATHAHYGQMPNPVPEHGPVGYAQSILLAHSSYITPHNIDDFHGRRQPDRVILVSGLTGLEIAFIVHVGQSPAG
jgi:hypothetical protein